MGIHNYYRMATCVSKDFRKLAYEINKNKEGYYVVYDFEANPKLIAELERNYRITDEIIKFIVVKK